MAKLAPGVKLLRSLNRAAKSQQSMALRLLDAYAAPPKKAARKASAARPVVEKAAPPARRPARPDLPPASGSFIAAHYSPPLQPGQTLATRLAYWLYLPQRVPDSVAQHGWPLVVMLHGCHQSATQFAAGTRMNRLAEEQGYAVLYPQQSSGAQAQRCWRWYDRAAQHGEGETAVLAGLLQHVLGQHAIDRRRIYACGLSAGAGMAAVLALNHPELIAAVGLHSSPVFGAGHSPIGALQVMRHGAPGQLDAAIHGLLARREVHAAPRLPKPMPPMPAILIQGEDDQVVHPVNQRQLAAQWLQLNGLPIGPATRIAVKAAARGGSRNAHEIHDYLVGRKLLLRVARVSGLAHAWSGGDPAVNFHAQAGPDASRMVLEFFGKHRR
jgi:poly(hydroxyalkanoate) depolymerase family esterase